MKKIISLLVVIVIVATACLVFAGCFNNNIPAFEVPEGGYDGSEVTITFLHCMGDALKRQLTRAIEDFKKLYPNITVKEENRGKYDDIIADLMVKVPNGQAPNLTYCYPDHVATYNETKQVVVLDNLINSKIMVDRADGTKEQLGFTEAQLNDFVKIFYDEGQSFGDDRMYLLPLAKSTELMYYNADFFEAHKDEISIPDHWFKNDENDRTSMEYTCEKIMEITERENATKPDSEKIQVIPFGYDSESNLFITLTEQMGSGYTTDDPDNHFVFDNAQNRDIMAKLKEWYNKRYFITKAVNKIGGSSEGSNTSDLLTNTDNASTPRAYMSIGSSGGASYNIPDDDSFTTGIAPIPQMNPDNPKAIMQGPDICIFNKENPQEVIASWLFLKFLVTNIDVQAGLSQVSGYIPATRAVENDELYLEFLAETEGNANIQAHACKVAKQLRDDGWFYISPAFYGSSVARDQVGLMVESILNNTDKDIPKIVENAFKDAMDQINYTLS